MSGPRGLLERLRGRWAGVGRRDRRALLLGTAVLVPVAVWAGVVRPYIEALDASRDRLAGERALLAREEALLAAADTLPLRLAEAEVAAAADLGRLIPAGNRPLAEAALTAALEEVAAASRVLLEDVRGVEEPAADTPAGLAAVRVGVQGESDVAGLTRFLHRIEASPLLMRIRGLDVSPRRADRRRDGAGPSPAEMGVVGFALVVEGYASAAIDNVEGGSVSEAAPRPEAGAQRP